MDQSLNRAWEELERGLQQVIYYELIKDLILLAALCVFLWCLCVYVINYKRLVDESVRLKKSQKQYATVKAERERLEIKRLKLEYGFSEELEKLAGF